MSDPQASTDAGRPSPVVDLVIPVHDPSRPLQRAIDSVAESGLRIPDELRISIVCHNVSPDAIQEQLTADARQTVRFLELNDGESSPAGPFMLGIRRATGKYVSIMGSDDTLEPGALAAWLSKAERLGLTALVPPERHASGKKVATPPIRPFRSGLLDAVRDRLAYRTAPLGLIRRDAIDRLGLDMPSSQRSGSDQLFGIKLWFSGEPIGYGRGTPNYVVGADAVSRVTFTPRPAREELRAVCDLVSHPWVLALPHAARRSIVTKSARVHLFSAAQRRSEGDSWRDDDRQFLRELLGTFREAAPDYERPLSIADRRLIDALEQGDRTPEAIGELARARRRFWHPASVLTRDLRGLASRDGPLRFMAASALL